MSELPKLNLDLLVQIIDWAEQSEQGYVKPGWGTWYQDEWGMANSADPVTLRNDLCQTAYCVAGQAAHQGGYRLIIIEDLMTRPMYSATSCVLTEPTGKLDSKGREIYADVGRPRSIPAVGAEVLGLCDCEEDLFEGDNDLEDLKAMTNGLAASRGLPLPYPDEPTRGGGGCYCGP